MRRILASLLVISALLGVGVFATSAYFSTSFTTPDVTFTAGTTDFDVSLVQGDQTIGDLGPGWTKHVCVKVENMGDFALNMTQKIHATAGLQALYESVRLRVRSADSSCTWTDTLNDWAPLSAYNDYVLPIGSVALSGSAYVIEDLEWIETGTDQNALQGQSFTLNVTISGQTP